MVYAQSDGFITDFVESGTRVTAAQILVDATNPDLEAQGKNPMTIDSKAEPTISFEEYALGENRYRTLKRVNPDNADSLLAESQKDVLHSWRFLKSLAAALEPETKEEE